MHPSDCVIRPWLLRSRFRSCSPTAMPWACSTAAQLLEAADDVRFLGTPLASPRNATWRAWRHAAHARKGLSANARRSSRRSSETSSDCGGALVLRRAAPAPARTRASQAPTSRSVDRARSASSPASCLRRAPGAWDCSACAQPFVRAGPTGRTRRSRLAAARIALLATAALRAGPTSACRSWLASWAVRARRPSASLSPARGSSAALARRPSDLAAPALSVPAEHTPHGRHALVRL